MDWQQAQKELTAQLTPLYGDREAAVIADWVMENLSGKKKLHRILTRSELLSPEALSTYSAYSRELLAHCPVQYVLHESWFAGMKLYVDENVLIPRPETEELVEWVVQEIAITGKSHATNSTMRPPSPILLDIGTGSGCIAIALAKQLPLATIHACDLSPSALAVAQRNAADQRTTLTFHQLDFLDSTQWHHLPTCNYLVSNPPYIPLKEKASMAAHVVDSEPDLALFVPDDDALVFYKALAGFARQRLLDGGSVFVEIHEELGQQTEKLFREAGYGTVVLRKDLQGKDRMIKATR